MNLYCLKPTIVKNHEGKRVQLLANHEVEKFKIVGIKKRIVLMKIKNIGYVEISEEKFKRSFGPLKK